MNRAFIRSIQNYLNNNSGQPARWPEWITAAAAVIGIFFSGINSCQTKEQLELSTLQYMQQVEEIKENRHKDSINNITQASINSHNIAQDSATLYNMLRQLNITSEQAKLLGEQVKQYWQTNSSTLVTDMTIGYDTEIEQIVYQVELSNDGNVPIILKQLILFQISMDFKLNSLDVTNVYNKRVSRYKFAYANGTIRPAPSPTSGIVYFVIDILYESDNKKYKIREYYNWSGVKVSGKFPPFVKIEVIDIRNLNHVVDSISNITDSFKSLIHTPQV